MNSNAESKKKIIVGITGASGAILGYRLVEALKESGEAEVHLIMSEAAVSILEGETDYRYEDICALADVVYDEKNLAAAVSSGSFRTNGMAVVPCSMKTLSGIANAFNENLIIRAADVCLKERRTCVLAPREMPLNSIHLRNMKECADAGYVIMPPVFTFYNHPKSMEDQIDHFVGKILMQFGIEYKKFRPWSGGQM